MIGARRRWVEGHRGPVGVRGMMEWSGAATAPGSTLPALRKGTVSMTTIELDPKLFLPDPEPRAIRYTLISVDDHLVEPPRHVRRPAARASCRTARRGSSRPKRATRSGSSTGRSSSRSGSTRSSGRKREDWQGRADPLRRDAPRLLRHRRPRPRHGHQRRVGVGELPVADHRLLRLGVLALLRSRARPRGARGRGTTGSSTSGTRRTPTASCRWASRTSPTPSRAPRRSAATRRAASPR